MPARPITALLNRCRESDSAAMSELMECVYPELLRLAARHMQAERPGGTLQPTALVHEAYLRLVDAGGRNCANRCQFYCAAATVMRRILVDHARSRQAWKRGGRDRRVELSDSAAVSADKLEEMLGLNDALEKLEALDARKSKVVEMRYFAGMTEEETADALGITVRTVNRDWIVARAYLRGMLQAHGTGSGVVGAH